ncbi:DUF305 domain-containing protein [Arthrobacter castelli]|uniref:DUF305 domain-containing protein n=1 Tax=Arthrobacter castelli TaxID=271431 RepID=UPI00047BAF76|nr:DUF305 domain-containing protein [Arthrobacter castelli]
MKKIFPLSAAALATAIVLAGCGADESGQMPSMDHSTMGTEQSTGASNSASTEGGSTDVSAEHNKADVMFAKMMSVHHNQAVTMSNIILDKENIDPQVTKLARQIKEAQGPEIQTMHSWLKAWGEPVPVGDHRMGGMDSMKGMSTGEMEGMMSGEQMQQLKTADGEKTATLFLSHMIEHHKGAVTMAQQEVKNGTSPEAIALAKQMLKAQKAEIETMNELLGTL